MNKIKNILVGFGITALVFATAIIISSTTGNINAAGLGSPQRVIDSASKSHSGDTNRLKGGTGYTNNAWVDCSNGKEVGIQITVQSTSTSTSNMVFWVYKSVDGVNLESSPFQTLTFPLTATAPVTIVTNFTVNGVPWVNFYAMTNGSLSTEYVTNLFVAVSVK